MRLEYFQLIDRVTALSVPQQTITVEALVPHTSTIFEGHFPGYPLMPGVLLVEAMAQACGWLVVAIKDFERMPFLAQIKEAKLRSFVPPGQALVIDGRILHEGSGFAMAKASITQDGKAVCEAELMFRVLPFPSDAFRAHMQAWAARLQVPLAAAPHG